MPAAPKPSRDRMADEVERFGATAVDHEQSAIQSKDLR